MRVYGTIACLLLISALPVMVECLWTSIKPHETWWNRRAALLWLALVIILCSLWPLLAVLVILELQREWRERRVAS